MGWQDIIKRKDDWVPKRLGAKPTLKNQIIEFLRNNRRGMTFNSIKNGTPSTRKPKVYKKILDDLIAEGRLELVWQKYGGPKRDKAAYVGKVRFDLPKVYNWIGE